GGGFVFPRLIIFLAHFVVHDGVPGEPALVAGDVVLAGPTPQPQFFDQVQLRQYAALHKPFLNNEVDHPMGCRMEHNRYIGPTLKFKEFFDFLSQKLPASKVKLTFFRVCTELSYSATFASLAACTQDSGSSQEDRPENPQREQL